MQVMEANKIIGAVLLGLLVWRGLDFVADLSYGTEHGGGEHEPAYVVAADGEGGGEASEPEKVVPLSVRLANADPAAGEKDAKKCATCHKFDEGGGNGIGPNLWNVVGRPKGGLSDFAYSSAITDLGGDWTYEDLDAFLTSPKTYAPGTKMSFAGMSKPEARADTIAYLRTLSESPVPLPEVAESEEIPSPAASSATETETDTDKIAEGRVEEEQATEEQAPAETEAQATETTEQPATEAPDEAAAEEPAAEQPASEETAAAEPAEEPAAEAPAESGGEESAFAKMVAAADPAAGEKASRICAACHKFEAGAGSGIGPNLHDVVDRDIASYDDFKYSKALEELEGDWTVDNLNDFLANPRSFAPGTKMAFPGIRDEQDRADVIAYLRSLEAQ
ncbi:MAG: cytochrome Cy [Rhodospirillaceae bacterium]|nr:cytochrome Cy [Rhodospirillaceae bacterium]